MGSFIAILLWISLSKSFVKTDFGFVLLSKSEKGKYNLGSHETDYRLLK